MATTYIEQDCTIEHEGRTFESGGAVVTPDQIIAYLGEQGSLTDWHGTVIGGYTVTSSWRTPNSYVSDKLYQVRAWVDGVRYTGRSAGVGMIFKGKRIRGQGRSN